MKKIIKSTLLALLALPLLAGCGDASGKVDIENLAKEAANIVGVAYTGFASTEGISLAGQDLITEYTYEGYKFNFEYEVSAFSETANYKYEYLKIENNKLVVKIPTFAELNPGLAADENPSVTYARYILKADIKYAGVTEGKEVANDKIGEVVAHEDWNIRINAEKVEPVWKKIEEARKASANETVVTTGYVAAFMNNVDAGEFRNGVWIADGSYGMMLYGGNLDGYFSSLKIGDMIMVIGIASPFSGLFEIKPSKIAFVTSAPETIVQPTHKVVTEAELKAMKSPLNTNELVLVENCTITTNLADLTTDGSMSLKVKFGSTTWTAYVNKHTNKAHREALLAHLKAHEGESFTLKTLISCNNDKLQFGPSIFAQGEGLLENFIFA